MTLGTVSSIGETAIAIRGGAPGSKPLKYTGPEGTDGAVREFGEPSEWDMRPACKKIVNNPNSGMVLYQTTDSKKLVFERAR